MSLDPQRIRRLQPRVFKYSLDWRFLLPFSDPDKTFVFFEDDPEFSQTLEQVGIPLSNRISLLDIEGKEKSTSASVVFPFGLPVRWVGQEQADQIEFFRSMRMLIGDTGNLLVGFNNVWNYSSNPRTKYHYSSSRRMTSQLKEAGFKIIKVFGVIPTLSIPEYIFDLNSQTIYFALQHRFKGKPVLHYLLQLLSHTKGPALVSDVLPCYFIVATV
jgi:hypothetical protein